jgi:hypothetical protein
LLTVFEISRPHSGSIFSEPFPITLRDTIDQGSDALGFLHVPSALDLAGLADWLNQSCSEMVFASFEPGADHWMLSM